MNETFHVQTDDELIEKELKQIEADDQAIQTILLGLPEDIYAAIDMLHQDQPSFNQNYMQQPMPNLKDITDPTTTMNMALALMAKAFKLTYSTPTNNKQRISSNPRNRQIAQPSMNMGQDRQMQMVGDQNPRIQNVRNQNGLIVVLGNANPNRNGNLVAARAEDGSAEVHNYENCYDNEIFNMLTQEEQYTKLLKPIPEPHQVPHNDNNIISEGSSVEQSEGTVEQHPANVEKTHVLYDSLYNNLTIEVEKVNKSREELYFANTSKMANVSKPILIPNEEFSNDTTPSVARKFLNEVKSTIVTLQCVVKQIMTLDTHNWSSSAHQELHKIVKDEIFPIVNQVDARVQNFEIQFLKEAAKFVGDFKSLSKEADKSLAKHTTLELEIERFLRAVVSQDIMSVVQNNSVDEKSNLQTGLERTKERFENCIIKKENEYAKLWNDWYKKCEECKFDKISYDKAYHDMYQKLNGCKLSWEISRVFDQKDTTRGTSANTKFAKQSILGKPPKVGESHALSKPVTSNSIPTPQGSKFMKNIKVIAPGMFRINPFKPSMEEKHVPNKVRASVRTNPITISQPPIITKKVVNSDTNGLSSTGVENIKTRRPQSRSNIKNDRVPFVPKSSYRKNKEVDVEEHHRKLLLFRKKHMSSKCNNVKLATQNVKSKVVCAICKQCLIFVNHDVCLFNYVNVMSSHSKKQKANVSINEKQKKQQPKVKKTMKVGAIKRLASAKPSKPRSFLRWSPTGRMFDLKGKIIAFSDSKSQSDCSKGDNACTSNPLEPTIKRFPNSTISLAGKSKIESHPPKPVPNSRQRLHLLHMDLCGPMRIASINGKRYVLVIVDDYSRYTWVQFLRSKDEAPEMIKTFLKRISILFQSLVIIIRTDNSTEFKNQVLKEYFDSVGISHQVSSVRTPQQNGVVERRNQTALCYPKNNREDIRKLGAKGLDLTYASSTITTPQPTEGELDLLFKTRYDDYIGGQPSAALRTILAAQAHKVHQTPMTSTSIADNAPTPTNSSSQATIFPNSSQDVDGLKTQQQHAQQQGNQAPFQPETVSDNVPNAMFDANTFVNPFANPSTSAAESSFSQYVDPSNMHMNQLRSDGDMCMYVLTVSTMEPRNVKEAMNDPSWIESMQEELL
nr:Gag-Pol polyprotein [Tanacetum cinerariifolium]